MALVYVTGISRSGKSTVRHELVRHGHEAHDTDDGMARFVDRSTGVATRRIDASLRTREFVENNDWVVEPDRVLQLSHRAVDRLVFLCGAIANEVEVWELFDRVILLSIDEATMRERVIGRTTNDFGKNPHELELMLGWIKTIDDEYRRYGAVVIDATRPISIVVDEIVETATCERSDVE